VGLDQPEPRALERPVQPVERAGLAPQVLRARAQPDQLARLERPERQELARLAPRVLEETLGHQVSRSTQALLGRQVSQVRLAVLAQVRRAQLARLQHRSFLYEGNECLLLTAPGM
jgi:hypothetical protein